MANRHHIWTTVEEEELIRARTEVHTGRNKWNAIKSDPQFQMFNHMTIDAVRSKYNSLKRSGRVPQIGNAEANVVRNNAVEHMVEGELANVEANLQVGNMVAEANIEQMGEHSLVDNDLLSNVVFSYEMSILDDMEVNSEEWLDMEVNSEEWLGWIENNEENNVNEAHVIHQPVGFCQGNNPVDENNNEP